MAVVENNMKIMCRGTPLDTHQIITHANATCSQPGNATSSGLSGAAGSQPILPIIAPPSGRDPQSPPLKRWKAGKLNHLGDMSKLVPSQDALQKWGERAYSMVHQYLKTYVRCAGDAQPGAKRRYDADDQGLGQSEDAKRDDADAEANVQHEVAEVRDSHGKGGAQLDDGNGDGTTNVQPDAGGNGDVRFPAEDGHEDVRLPAKDCDEQVRRNKVFWQQRPSWAGAQWEDVYPGLQTRLEEAGRDESFLYTGRMYGCRANLAVDMKRMVYIDNGHGGQHMRLQRIRQTVICDDKAKKFDAQISINAELLKMPDTMTLHWQMKMGKAWKYMTVSVSCRIMDHILGQNVEPVVNVDHYYRSKNNLLSKTIYKMDLTNMTQTNTDSGTKRPIRLVGEEAIRSEEANSIGQLVNCT